MYYLQRIKTVSTQYENVSQKVVTVRKGDATGELSYYTLSFGIGSRRFFFLCFPPYLVLSLRLQILISPIFSSSHIKIMLAASLPLMMRSLSSPLMA